MEEFEKQYFIQQFKIKIYEYSGQAFEDFFCKIMKAVDDSFQKVKAYGNRGDYSCDGLNVNTGDYYLCYSPDNILKETTQKNAKIKIKNDLKGIVSKWSGIKQIHYVINDSFKGLPPMIIQTLQDLKSSITTYIDIYSMEKLMDVFISLPNDKMVDIIGFCPNLESKEKVAELFSFETISHIVEYIEKNSSAQIFEENLVVPDFDEKIDFNKLSNVVSNKLKESYVYISKVEQFFNEVTNLSKDSLRNNLVFIYKNACAIIPNDHESFADERFFYILEKICYKMESKAVVENCIIILTAFFESCDIFEEPAYD